MAGTLRCARPGCGGVATAWLSYDYAGQRVWLDDPGAQAAGHHSALCATHAGRLRPPQGWSCHDRRTMHGFSSPPAPPLPPRSAAPPAAPAVPSPADAEPAGAAAPPAGANSPPDRPDGDSSPGLTAIAV